MLVIITTLFLVASVPGTRLAVVEPPPAAPSVTTVWDVARSPIRSGRSVSNSVVSVVNVVSFNPLPYVAVVPHNVGVVKVSRHFRSIPTMSIMWCVGSVVSSVVPSSATVSHLPSPRPLPY